jgi:hypothetical protein
VTPEDKARVQELRDAEEAAWQGYVAIRNTGSTLQIVRSLEVYDEACNATDDFVDALRQAGK